MMIPDRHAFVPRVDELNCPDDRPAASRFPGEGRLGEGCQERGLGSGQQVSHWPALSPVVPHSKPNGQATIEMVPSQSLLKYIHHILPPARMFPLPT
jgi:hypothetical protein